MIRICIDARTLSQRLSGIGRYVMELVAALQSQDSFQLELHAPSKIPSERIYALRQCTVYTSRVTSDYGRFLWGEVGLPLSIRKNLPDLFWGPAHRIPRLGLKSVPKLLTIHDLVWKRVPESMRLETRVLDHTLTPSSIRRADHILTVSEATKRDLLEEYGVPAECVSVVYPGAILSSAGGDHSCATPSPDYGSNFVLFVGTIEPRKNLIRLLEAYAELSAELREQSPLVIVGGEGWGDVNLARRTRELGIAGDVHLPGYLKDTELLALYRHARFLAMPSLYEGFGLPLVEAMSQGTPVLTSNTASMPEVAGDAGHLVDPLSRHEIRQGLEELISNDSKLKKLTESTLSQASRFDWNRSSNVLGDIIKDMT